MESKHIHVNGCRIHYMEALPKRPSKGCIVFLHGFPENWQTWRKQIAFFSAEYRVIAPDLPGYNQSSKPENLAFYAVPNLIEVIRQFIETVQHSQQKIILVAHDWGGAIAWPLVAFNPELFSHLIILNAAHPSTFTREMICNPVQRQKSGYIHQLIADDAETVIVQNSYSLLTNMFVDEQQNSVLTDNELNEYRKSWARPAVLISMLKYYQAMPQLAPSQQDINTNGPVVELSKMKVPNIRITTKTLVLWGEKDLAFVPQLLDGLEEYVKDVQIEKFAEANHWLHHQFPDLVNQHILTFIEST
ncbi:alpha/beta hydrolase [Aliiglaciecola sp. LCG003]|uniref:alpha/beta fold hydrolase n=1 Tax=Aliiglaciecola sp. LCG003 TaxID=3053655 RepID=UPI0025743288|nr:alpha/beta hydrolase [Aliiglaciecola sp. LCG003]WJG10746.1 alpha/beta hydrolase [Aliiglaciecola sp. LCG003]WJG10752.1 alpha/beta hydrolase [Aliiglaciecola sp. LCG003]